MKLLGNLYFIEAVNRPDEGGICYTIRLNAEHVIYKAHFPEEPITPGVCIIQTGMELLDDATGGDMELSCVKNVKFLNILHPDGTPVNVSIKKIEETEGIVKAQIEFSIPDTPIAKMSLVCTRTAR